MFTTLLLSPACSLDSGAIGAGARLPDGGETDFGRGSAGPDARDGGGASGTGVDYASGSGGEQGGNGGTPGTAGAAGEPTQDGGTGGDSGTSGAGGTAGTYADASLAGPDAGTDAGIDTGDAASALLCGESPPPTVSHCPPECNGGCADGACNILCGEVYGCATTITCPAGLPCKISCSGAGSCPGIPVYCPADHGCEVAYTGANTCPGLPVFCGNGPCEMDCSGLNVCSGAVLICGPNSCTTNAPLTAYLTLSCGPSCDCP